MTDLQAVESGMNAIFTGFQIVNLLKSFFEQHGEDSEHPDDFRVLVLRLEREASKAVDQLHQGLTQAMHTLEDLDIDTSRTFAELLRDNVRKDTNLALKRIRGEFRELHIRLEDFYDDIMAVSGCHGGVAVSEERRREVIDMIRSTSDMLGYATVREVFEALRTIAHDIGDQLKGRHLRFA